ncbi:hypothetical protein [Devosia sp. CN2-171]|uniref:hypothetical protein n=1 Tax=Devosia sp. CN2-171 TaxID=3400909 RepID=UPI003BF7D556
MKLAYPKERMATLAMLLLKGLNLVSNVAYTFLIVYVMIRATPHEVYPVLVIFLAASNYVSLSDFGYTNIVYADLRRAKVNGAQVPDAVVPASTLYAYIVALAAVVGVVVLLWLDISPDLKLALWLLFLASCLNLPWNLLKKTAAALDLYLQIEVLDAVRRILAVGALASTLLTSSVLATGVIQIFIWIAAYLAGAVILRREGLRLFSSGPTVVLGHLRRHIQAIRVSGALWALEFVVYNFPYVALPLLYPGDLRPVVVFDLFYKVMRFAGAVFTVPAESLLPQQTQAYHQGDMLRARRQVHIAAGIGLVGLSVAIPLLLVAGPALFTVLLDGRIQISPSILFSMAAMIALIWVVATAGTFLLGVGRLAAMTRSSMLAVTGFAIATAFVAVLKLGYESFFVGYVCVYALNTILYYRIYRVVIQGESPKGEDVI